MGEGVAHQVRDDLGDPRRVQDRPCVTHRGHGDLPLRHRLTELVDDSEHHSVGVRWPADDGNGSAGPGRAEVEQRSNELVHATRRTLHLPEALTDLLGQGLVSREDARESADAAERVAQVVRQDGHHQVTHAQGLVERSLRSLQLGHVRRRADDAGDRPRRVPHGLDGDEELERSLVRRDEGHPRTDGHLGPFGSARGENVLQRGRELPAVIGTEELLGTATDAGTVERRTVEVWRPAYPELRIEFDEEDACGGEDVANRGVAHGGRRVLGCALIDTGEQTDADPRVDRAHLRRCCRNRATEGELRERLADRRDRGGALSGRMPGRCGA